MCGCARFVCSAGSPVQRGDGERERERDRAERGERKAAEVGVWMVG